MNRKSLVVSGSLFGQEVFFSTSEKQQKNRGGPSRATPSLRNYIKQRARLHTVVLIIGIIL